MTAACTNHPTLDWFSPADYPAAAAICATCDQRAGCEAGARARGEQFGCWGGWIADEVTMLDGFPVEPAAEVVEHSRSAYNAKAHGDCAACAKRNAEWVAQWRAGKRADAVSQVVEAGPEQLTFEGMTA